MVQLEAQSLAMTTPQATKTAVLVIGGAEDKVHGREILHTFFGRAGSTDAHIAIIPSASREPAITGGRYLSIFEEMGAKQVELLDIQQREQCEEPQIQACLEACTGVFLTGGDQLRLCAVLADTPVMETIRLRVQRGKTDSGGDQRWGRRDGLPDDCWWRQWRVA